MWTPSFSGYFLASTCRISVLLRALTPPTCSTPFLITWPCRFWQVHFCQNSSSRSLVSFSPAAIAASAAPQYATATVVAASRPPLWAFYPVTCQSCVHWTVWVLARSSVVSSSLEWAAEVLTGASFIHPLSTGCSKYWCSAFEVPSRRQDSYSCWLRCCWWCRIGRRRCYAYSCPLWRRRTRPRPVLPRCSSCMKIPAYFSNHHPRTGASASHLAYTAD